MENHYSIATFFIILLISISVFTLSNAYADHDNRKFFHDMITNQDSSNAGAILGNTIPDELKALTGTTLHKLDHEHVDTEDLAIETVFGIFDVVEERIFGDNIGMATETFGGRIAEMVGNIFTDVIEQSLGIDLPDSINPRLIELEERVATQSVSADSVEVVLDNIQEVVLDNGYEIVPETLPEPVTVPENNLLKEKVRNFPSITRAPEYYIEKYNKDESFRDWFASEFPSNTIEEVVGYEKTHIEGFPALDKPPRYYINLYKKESVYRDWFDSQFPNISIHNVLGFSNP